MSGGEMDYQEHPLWFSCAAESLLGIVAIPQQHAGVGVLVLVGGPQYRVGSHRQFVALARHLARHGVPCMRFDYRGMGDSTGPSIGFAGALPDVRAAIDAFYHRLPELKRVVLWGLCDGASVACLYAQGDERVAGLALANPWVRTPENHAETYLRHYYMRRLLETEFWRKLARGQFNFRSSLASVASLFPALCKGIATSNADESSAQASLSLPDAMASGLSKFGREVLIILSGGDLTAEEFNHLAARSSAWKKALARNNVAWKRIPDCDHTFSQRQWAATAAAATLQWIHRLSQQSPSTIDSY